MANTYHQVCIQTIFAPKYREARLKKDLQQEAFAVIGNLINETGCKTYIVNGMEDHVHCLLGLKPTVCISDLMKAVKAKSSKHINDNHLTKARFEWQEGYAAFSYCHSERDQVYQYILNQEAHHRTHTFQEEYREFLTTFGIDFEEQYLLEDLI
ncbi:MAG TPA: IS200/IS605 family transposase [Chryseosolibacter sp.]